MSNAKLLSPEELGAALYTVECGERARDVADARAAIHGHIAALEADNAALRDLLGKSTQVDPGVDHWARVGEVLNQPHPGAALLEAHAKALVRTKNEGREQAAEIADNAAQTARLQRARMQTSVMRTAWGKAAETASEIAALVRKEKESEQ